MVRLWWCFNYGVDWGFKEKLGKGELDDSIY